MDNQPEQPRTEMRRASPLPWIAVGVVVIAAAAYWFLRPREAPPRPPPPAAAAPMPPAEPASPAPPENPKEARQLLEAISTNALYRKAIAEGDLTRRWAVVTDNLAEGVSPRKQLSFLAPGRPFTVATRGGRTVIAAESYARYDAFAAAVASLDAGAAAAAYRALHAVVEGAYRALGYPTGSLDRVTARALRRLVNAPAVDGEVAVVEGKGMQYAYADPRLEVLGEVEKHLLRMGPANTRRVQAKAREIAQALGLPLAVEAGGGAR